MLILIFHDLILSFSCSWYMHGFLLIIIIIIIIIIKLLITSYLANRMSRKIITMKKKLL